MRKTQYGEEEERTVNPLTVVVDNLLDETLGLQSPHSLSGHGSVDLHSLDQDGLRDHLVGRDFLEDLVAARRGETTGGGGEEEGTY